MASGRACHAAHTGLLRDEIGPVLGTDDSVDKLQRVCGTCTGPVRHTRTCLSPDAVCDISRSCAPRHRPRLLRQQFFTALQPAVLLSSVFQQVSGTGADSAPAAVCHGDTCRDRIFRSRRRPRAGFGDRYAQTLPGAPDRGGRHRGAPGDCTPATEQPARESSRLDVP